MRLNIALSILLLLSCSAAAFADDSAAAAADQAKPIPEHAQKSCLRDTGSRIPSRHEDGCLSVHGTSYSREDLQSEGQGLVGEGLWRYDPALQITGRR
ncbi:MAG: hypothetical protein NVS9B10_20420 [Nevskia sp.]